MVQIHVCEPPGDILVFLTGEEEIEDACKKISKEITQMGEQARRGARVQHSMRALRSLHMQMGEHAPPRLTFEVSCVH